MANVNTSASNTRQHTETVIFRAGRVMQIHRIRPLSFPLILPFFLNFRRIVAFHICNYSKNPAHYERDYTYL